MRGLSPKGDCMNIGQIIDLCLGTFIFGGSIYAHRIWNWNPVFCFMTGCYGIYLLTNIN